MPKVKEQEQIESEGMMILVLLYSKIKAGFQYCDW